jgi:hypothetical protein
MFNGMRYNPRDSIFAGMSTEQLQAALISAQNAYLNLQTGAQAVTLSYAQGDGSKSVTYIQTNTGALVQLIRQLQAQLGMTPHPRRPIRFRY